MGCGSLSCREEEGAKISWTPKAKQFRVAFIVYIEFLQLFIFAVGHFLFMYNFRVTYYYYLCMFDMMDDACTKKLPRKAKLDHKY